MKRGALFDLDGVIIDTEGIYSGFWGAIDERFPTGIPHFAQAIKGMNLQEILGNHFPADIQPQIHEMLMQFQADMKYEYFPGAMDFVRMLRDNGFAVAIVTSSDQQKMNELYSQHPEFESTFDAVITGDMVTHAKPHPECYQLAARLIGSDLKDCIVFEDSVNGLKAGLASGAKVVGLTGTYGAEVVKPLCHVMTDHLRNLSLEMLP